MEVREYLKDYYENYDEDGRLKSRHGSVEFLTTVRYIEKYLKPGMKIIERCIIYSPKMINCKRRVRRYVLQI